MSSKQNKQGFGLSYNKRLGYGAVVGAVRVYLISKL